MKEGASSLTEYFHMMWNNTSRNECATIFLIAACYATFVSILLCTSMNRLIEHTQVTELIAAITWIVLLCLMRFMLTRAWKSNSQRFIDLAHKNIFEHGLLLTYTWDVLERHERQAQARRPSEQLTRPRHAQVPIRVIDVLERFVRAYPKLCDDRRLFVIVDSSARTRSQQSWLLASYITLALHIGWAVLEIYAAYGIYSATAVTLLAMFLGIAVGSHQTLQYFLLDVIVRRALLREFLGV